MSNNADGTPGTGPSNTSAGASDTAAAPDIERMINDAVSKALGPRLKRERSSMEDLIAAKVADALSKVSAPAEARTVSEPTMGDQPEKLNLKALDNQVKAQLKALQDRLEASERQRTEAEQRANQTRLQADLQSAFAKHAGHDNPHMAAYLKMYADQFRMQDGRAGRVVKDDYGEEQFVPLEQATEDLFKGELKHLIPARSSNLPTTSIARGMPMPAPGAQQRGGIFEAEILHHQAMSDPALYSTLYGPKK